MGLVCEGHFAVHKKISDESLTTYPRSVLIKQESNFGSLSRASCFVNSNCPTCCAARERQLGRTSDHRSFAKPCSRNCPCGDAHGPNCSSEPAKSRCPTWSIRTPAKRYSNRRPSAATCWPPTPGDPLINARPSRPYRSSRVCNILSTLTSVPAIS